MGRLRIVSGRRLAAEKGDLLEEQDVRLRLVDLVVFPAQTLCACQYKYAATVLCAGCLPV
jgi:hypothetical protein